MVRPNAVTPHTTHHTPHTVRPHMHRARHPMTGPQHPSDTPRRLHETVLAKCPLARQKHPTHAPCLSTDGKRKAGNSQHVCWDRAAPHPTSDRKRPGKHQSEAIGSSRKRSQSEAIRIGSDRNWKQSTSEAIAVGSDRNRKRLESEALAIESNRKHWGAIGSDRKRLETIRRCLPIRILAGAAARACHFSA
jgi:hypothetical protein